MHSIAVNLHAGRASKPSSIEHAMQHSPPHCKVEVAFLDLHCKRGKEDMLGWHWCIVETKTHSRLPWCRIRDVSWQQTTRHFAPAQSTQTRVMLFWKGVPAVLHAKLFFLVSAVSRHGIGAVVACHDLYLPNMGGSIAAQPQLVPAGRSKLKTTQSCQAAAKTCGQGIRC